MWDDYVLVIYLPLCFLTAIWAATRGHAFVFSLLMALMLTPLVLVCGMLIRKADSVRK